MNLNSSAARLPVGFAADAIGFVSSAMDGTRVPTMSGAMSVLLGGGFDASAMRRADFELVMTSFPDFAPNVQRMAVGAGVLTVGADLYYTKLSIGFGSALVSVEVYGDVGIVFGDGEASIDPLGLNLDVARRRHGSGDAVCAVDSYGEASAIRRPAVSSVPFDCGLIGVLEPTHITAGGVRYVGMFVDAALTVLPEDGGLIRQAFLGSMDLLALAGTADLRTIRPTLAGEAVSSVVMSADFQVERRATAAAVTELAAAVEFFCIVEGEGEAVVVCSPAFLGSVLRKGGGVSEIVLLAALEGLRARLGDAEVELAFLPEMAASRFRLCDAGAVIDALSFASAVVNPYAEDDGEQNFNKPALDREFSRPASAREFFR
jgi:hypothetical protein